MATFVDNPHHGNRGGNYDTPLKCLQEYGTLS